MTSASLAASARSLTMNGLLRARALEHGQRPAIIDGASKINYATLESRTNRLANALAAKNIAAGDRVATLLLDSLPSVELLLANGKLGAITVTLNWRLAATEIAWILESAQPKLLFYSSSFAHLVPDSTPFPCIRVEDNSSERKTYEALVADGADIRPEIPVHSNSPLYMLYTSGTTGRPKGCLQGHHGTVVTSMGFAIRRGLTSEDRLISTAPLFHVGGLSHVFAAIAAGSSIVIAPRTANSEQMLRLISEQGCSFGSAHDQLLTEMIALQDDLRLPLKLRSLTRGASMTSAEEIETVGRVLGAEVVGGYGQSEVGGFATMLDGREMRAHPKSIGWPLPHLEATLLDELGNPAVDACDGELGLRGPAVTLGYWHDATATEEAIGTGWLRTGDMVERDQRGLLHFLGRRKELVKTGGENVYPAEVETVLRQHPAVADAAIVGVPDRRWGEAVKAFIVLKPGTRLERAQAVDWCREHMAGYKRPRYIEYIDSIPRDHLNKIQRRELSARPLSPEQTTD